MAPDPIAWLSLTEVSGRIADGKLTSRAVTERMIERIARLDPHLHAFHRLMAETALAEADAADAAVLARQHRGLLHGVPIAIKDLIDVRGVPTAAGTTILADTVAAEDSTVVARLRAAGAVILGKLHMTEGAHLDHHPERPRPANPWSEAHWTGVSSSGSAVAPAAGLCYATLGSDTGGSIRMPSAACNLSGIKPTWGRVSRKGVFPLAESLDHVGPMARTVADAAVMLQAIAGFDASDPTTLAAPVPDYAASLEAGCADLSIGIDWGFACEGLAEPIVQAMHEAARVLADLGARIVEVRLPSTATLGRDTAAMVLAEIAAAHDGLYPARADAYGPRLHAVLTAAHGVDAVAVASAYQARDRFHGALAPVLDSVDLLLMPGLGGLVPTWEDVARLQDDMGALSRTLLRFTVPFNMTGVPTLSLPGGFDAAGLPIGLQLVGRPLAEPALIAAGHAFQQRTDYHRRRPPLAQERP
ncbi:amidase [Sphingomonas oryzagri]